MNVLIRSRHTIRYTKSFNYTFSRQTPWSNNLLLCAPCGCLMNCTCLFSKVFHTGSYRAKCPLGLHSYSSSFLSLEYPFLLLFATCVPLLHTFLQPFASPVFQIHYFFFRPRFHSHSHSGNTSLPACLRCPVLPHTPWTDKSLPRDEEEETEKWS